MSDFRKRQRQVHPIVRLDYVVRLVACPFVLLIVVSSRMSSGEPVPLGLWIVLGLYAVAWPHVAYFFASRTEELRDREVRFLMGDAAAAGIAIALSSIRPVPTLVIITAMLSILTSVGGVPLLVAGMSILAATLLLTGTFVTDFTVATNTPILAEMMSAATLLMFQTMMGLLTYRTARNFVVNRRHIAEQAEQIRIQNDELVAAREEALQAAKAKSAFLATMSHEIRTPLNGVLGMTRLLAETPMTPEQQDLLRTVQVSGNTLVTVINDVLDYSRIESGRLDLEEEPLDLAQVVEESLEIVSDRAREKGIELVCDVAPEVPETVLGDSTRLRQVVTNLVGNAVKFTERGEVVVSVRQLYPDRGDEPGEISIAVRDTGIGIPEDRIAQLFTPFSQADASTTRRYGGSGLGLAISKRLVTLMGGSIGVKSFPGVGTTFSFTIRARAGGARKRRRNPLEIRGKRVLVVDDNATNRRVLCGQLELWGLVPVGTESAERALKVMDSEEPFDVAILDYHMPDVDGMTLARRIRARGSRSDLPLILLSSSLVLAKDDPERLFASRLMKPARQSSLFDSIMVALGVETSARAARLSEPGLLVPTDAKPLNILVADDNEINRNVAALVLRRFGYESDFAVNGRDAIDRVTHRAMSLDDEGPYDLVFMDVQMPEMDGLEATRAIRRLEAARPDEHWPRIVAMTANALQEDRDICIEAGMDDYLMKPLDFEAVAKVLRDTTASLPAAASRPREGSVGSDGSDALIDWARIEELREYDTPEGSIVKGAITTLLDDAPLQLEEIQGSLESRDATALREAAHKLRGAASNIGAAVVSTLASRVESLAVADRLDDAAAILPELRSAVEATSVELLRYVGQS